MSLLGTQTAPEKDSAAGLAIRRVEIVRLFGIYSYDLALDPDVWGYEPDLMILYGDNGSGKTTILKLIFHLLSPEDDVGHRGYLARVPFKEFKVSLSDGTTIGVKRPTDDLDGSYRYFVSRNSKKVLDHQFFVDTDGDLIDGDSNGPEDYERLMSFLKNLNLKFHYLGDDRKVATDYSSDRRYRRRYRWLAERHLSDMSHSLNDAVVRGELATSEDNLQLAVKRAEDFVRREAFARSTRGSENANSVYTELVHRIISSAEPETNDAVTELSELRSKIDEIQRRNKSFQELGLSASLNLAELQDSLRDASAHQFGRIITGILEPYINGINARLDALQTLHDVMLTFLGHLNSFYANKYVTLHLNDGIHISAASGQELGLNKLSSGEKQLLLLLCNALSARHEASVFIIDEPEISLNVKWQRRLVRALLDCMQGSPAQFLFATHSLEIVSQYGDHRVDLENLNEVHAS